MSVDGAVLRKSLLDRLSALPGAYATALSAIAALSKLGADVSMSDDGRYGLFGILVKAMNIFFVDLCGSLTALHCAGTPARINPPQRLYSFSRHDNEILPGILYDALTGIGDLALDEQIKLVNRLVEAIPFEEIAEDINGQVAGLKDEGLRMLADKTINVLNVRSYRMEPKITKRHVVFDVYFSGYYHTHDQYRDFDQVRDALFLVADLAGIEFGYALSELMNRLRSLTYNEQSIPSRTVFGKGHPLEIACFNGRFEFRFTHQAYDALAAFVALHGSESNREAMASLSANLAKAA